ncbi:serine/threonine-protein kinase [uncultured Thiohalocapsa sp.]|uniref:serine/threonine protein kinase n=1 Tax=uncultured Thiohalocapsa sp. TaxID=768990 RepID=UPI0025E7E932|nr:serine/threonine-protein kinase [uncultured Thiohalocapsa sp.]
MDINGTDRCLGCMEEKRAAQVCPHCGWDETGAQASPLALPLGDVLNEQYVVGRMLGHGGFGITYLAWDQRLNTRVAVKEYMPRDQVTRAKDGRSVAVFHGEAAEQFSYGLSKFLEEARNLARFTEHPGIVTVLGFFEAHGTAYMVMQYIDGLDLKAYLSQVGGHLPTQAGLGIMSPVLDALRAVHDAGLLHRDLSPDNIYITRTSRVMILDFGAARDALGSHSRSLAMVHKEGFSPEEQYRVSGHQGPWTDIYAAAATLYRMLTGKTPPDAMERLAQDTLEPPSRLGVILAPDQEAALTKALAVRAPARFQDVRSFQAALFATAPQPSAQPPAQPPAQPSPSPPQEPYGARATPPPGARTARDTGGTRWMVPVLILLIAVLAAGLGWSLTRPPAQPPGAAQAGRDEAPFAVADDGPSAADLLAEAAREAELERQRQVQAERRREAQAERQRQAELERRRREQEQEREQARQAAVDRAATAAAAAVRSYYRHVDNGSTSAAMALWHEVNNPDSLRGLISGTRNAEVLRIDRIRLDRSLLSADVPVLVRVTGADGRTECWVGPIAMNKFGGAWKIETMKGLRKRACP